MSDLATSRNIAQRSVVFGCPRMNLGSGESVAALAVKTVPGLWYQASWGDSIDGMTQGEKVQAAGDTLYLGVIRQTGSIGFYKVTVSER